MTTGRPSEEPHATRRIPRTPAEETFSSAAHPPPSHWQEPAPAATHHQPGSPQRRSSGCLGVVLTLCLAVWASLGTLLLLSAWAQASAGTHWASAAVQTLRGALQDGAGVGNMLLTAPVFLAASALCVVAALLLPSAAGLVRGAGMLLLLGGAAAYALAVILEVTALAGDPVTRWQAAAALWPRVDIADLVLVPLFFIGALVCVLATSPRKQ